MEDNSKFNFKVFYLHITFYILPHITLFCLIYITIILHLHKLQVVIKDSVTVTNEF